MSEERLKEIKDSIDFQLSLCDIPEYETSKLLVEEELELYNEVVRLREENEELKSVNSYSKRELYKFNKKLLETNLKLVKERDRLRDNNEMAISLCNEYLYHDDVCGNEKNINYEELKYVLKRNNLTLEQLTGVENE